jgi:beta-lactamase regulating signal transducer with metallopeptidase domain
MTFLLACTVKVSIIVAIALVVARLLQRKSAAVRHWILSAAVICIVFIPFASRLLPAWNMGRIIVSPAAISTSIEGASQTVAGPEASPIRTQAGLTGRLAPWLWLAGLSMGLLTLFIGWIRLARLSTFSGRDVGVAWTATADEISKLYGLRHPVQLLRSQNSAILVTWGVFRPKILLPAGSEEWPGERIRAVLCHEMSHIRRGDWWIQTTAELLRAVYWFNPLIWILCQRLRVESEYACDDAVLSQGITGPEYATQLLDIVCLLQITDRPWSSALGMASPSTIERRFAAMLNPQINRRSVSRFAMLVIAIVGFVISLPLAALSTSARLQAQTHEPVTVISNTASSSGLATQPQTPAVQPPSREVTKAAAAAAAIAVRPTPPQVSAPATPAPTQQQTQYRGSKISLNVNGMSSGDFFRLIGETSGLNVIVDPSLPEIGPLVFHVTNIPWDQLLDGVLTPYRLISQLDGNILRILQAPTPAQESITMDFEIYRNGSMLGAPRITTVVAHSATVGVSQGGAAGIDIKITATPSRTSEGKIRIELEIFVGNSGTREVLFVSSGEQKSISWRSSSGESLEARITAVEKK